MPAVNLKMSSAWLSGQNQIGISIEQQATSHFGYHKSKLLHWLQKDSSLQSLAYSDTRPK